jgi:hypothetical protein
VIRKAIGSALVWLTALTITPAQAVTIGGYEVTGFASSVTSFSGLFSTNTGSFNNAVTDTSVDTYVWATATSSSFGLGFASGTLVNNVGADLVLFEIGTTSDPFALTIGSTTQTLTATDTGFTTTGGLQLNAVTVDLGAFGVASGASVDSILLALPVNGADFALAGALEASPIPVPAAVWMFGSGLIGLVGIARRRRA